VPTKTLISSLPVQGSSSTVSVYLIPRDHVVAGIMGHEPLTGRWVDQYEVTRSEDKGYDIQPFSHTGKSWAQALRLASSAYRSASADAAQQRWDEAERDMRVKMSLLSQHED
jgi:hypothetical protein